MEGDQSDDELGEGVKEYEHVDCLPKRCQKLSEGTMRCSIRVNSRLDGVSANTGKTFHQP